MFQKDLKSEEIFLNSYYRFTTKDSSVDMQSVFLLFQPGNQQNRRVRQEWVRRLVTGGHKYCP